MFIYYFAVFLTSDFIITNALFTCLEITLFYTSICLPHSLLAVADLNYKRLVHRCTIACTTENDSPLNCGHAMDPYELKFAGTLRRLQNHLNITNSNNKFGHWSNHSDFSCSAVWLIRVQTSDSLLNSFLKDQFCLPPCDKGTHLVTVYDAYAVEWRSHYVNNITEFLKSFLQF